MFVKEAIAKIPNPIIILNNWDNANGCQDPPPAEYKTTSDKIKTKHIGTKIPHENRPSLSDILIIFAFEIRVCLDIFYSLLSNSFIVAATVRAALPLDPECSVITHTAYLGLFVGAYPTKSP